MDEAADPRDPVHEQLRGNFSDLPVDVTGDGLVDLVQIGYVARRLVWLANPGKQAEAAVMIGGP